MKLCAAVVIFATGLLPEAASAEMLDHILIKDNRLSYKGYVVTKTYDPDRRVSEAVIRKGQRVLARLKQGNNLADLTSFALFPFLGGKEKQLIIQQHHGGAHCCYSWRIYDLYPAFRLIFKSERYPIGDGVDDALIEDLDKDGTFEFIQNSNKFAYFNHRCFVCLPRPVVVFRYDKTAMQYLPANHIFPSFALRDVKASIDKVKALNSDRYGDSFPYVLDVALSYIYAGMERRAWAFYDRHYESSEKKTVKRLIKRELRNDGIYRFLYSKRQREEGTHLFFNRFSVSWGTAMNGRLR
jgi:hypothetical protein